MKKLLTKIRKLIPAILVLSLITNLPIPIGEFGNYGKVYAANDLGNIFTDATVTVDDKPVSDGDVLNITKDTEVKLNYTWAIPDGVAVDNGTTASIQLPSVFKWPDGAPTGPFDLSFSGQNVGTFNINGSTITITFNDVLKLGGAYQNNRQGNLDIGLFFNMVVFQTNVIQTFDLNLNVSKELTIIQQPSGGKAISKNGGAIGGPINAKQLSWTVDVNTNLQKIKNAVITDDISKNSGLTYTDGSLVINKLNVGSNGTLTLGEVVTGITPIVTQTEDGGSSIAVNLGDISSAYRITYKTDITDMEKTDFSNTAALTGDGVTKTSSTGTVTGITRPELLGKSVDAVRNNTNPNEIDWVIDINKRQADLSGVQVTDPMPAGLSVKSGSVKIYKITTNTSGGWNETIINNITAAGINDNTNYTIGASLNLDFGTVNGQAYRIKYTTTVDYSKVNGGEYRLSESFTNTATLTHSENLTGVTVSASAIVNRSSILSKGYGALTNDYETKEIPWTITVNSALQPITAVLKDKIPNGLAIKDGSLSIDSIDIPNASWASHGITYDTTTGILTVDLGSTSAVRTIKYTTTIDPTIYTGAVTNKAWLEGTGIGTGVGYKGTSSTNTVDVKYSPNIANQYDKAKVSIDYAKEIMKWKLTVQTLEKDITNLKITDTFPNNGLTLVPGTLKVTRDGTTFTDYTLNEKGTDGFILQFNNSLKGGIGGSEYVITYNTSFDPDLTGSIAKDNDYVNTAVFDADGTEITKSADFNLNSNTDKLVGKKTASLNRSARTLNWNIYINPLAQTYTKDVVIEDTFDTATQNLDMNSIKVFGYNLNTSGNFIESTELDKSNYTVQQTTGGFQLTFPGGITVPYVVKYTTNIKGISQPYYYNEAKVSSDGTVITTLNGKSPQYTQDNIFLTKNREDSTSTTVTPNQRLRWKISLNDSLSEITNAVLTDTISSGQEYDKNSLKVYKDDSTEPMEASEYILTSSVQGDGSTKLTISFGNISSHYTVKYETVVTSTSNNASINNSAGFTGSGTTINTTTNKTFTVKVYAGGTGSGDNTLGSIKVKKTDAVSGNIITSSEAGFKLYYVLNDTPRYIDGGVQTTKNGEYTFANLSAGVTYYLQEVSAPTGYVLNNTPQIIDMDLAKNIVYSFSNTKIKGNIQFIKLNEKGGYLPGAEFALYQKSDTNFENALAYAISGSDGKVEFTNVDYGDYIMKETKAPDKYTLNQTPIPVSITEDGKTVALSSVVNELAKGRIEITKQDSFTDAKLSGAEFAIYNQATKDEILKKTTDATGTVTFDLPYGEYYFKETVAPNGYILASQQKDFSITKEGELQTFVVRNQPKVTLQITKVDKTDPDKKLQGAKFRITGPDTNLEVETGTDGTVEVKGLGHGAYTVEEIAPPHGYQLSDNAKQEITIDENSTETMQVVFTNLKTRTIVIQKVDAADSGIKLEGAKFEVKTKKGVSIGEYATDGNGTIEVQDMNFGDYIITEVSPASGYQLSGNVSQGISITEDSQEPYRVNFTNEKLRKLTIKKVDSSDTTKVLAGAVFSVKGPNGYLADATTLEDGTVTLTGLKFGTYKITETKAPNGYSLNYTPVEVVINNGKEEFVVEVKDHIYVPVTNPSPEPNVPSTPTPTVEPTPTPGTKPTPVPTKTPEPTKKPEPTPTPEPVTEVTTENTPKGGKVPVPEGGKSDVGKKPEKGKVTVDDKGKWIYTPDKGYTGKDKFTIVIKHPDGRKEEVLVNINVDKVPLGNVNPNPNSSGNGVKIPKTGETLPIGFLPIAIGGVTGGAIALLGRKKKLQRKVK